MVGAAGLYFTAEILQRGKLPPEARSGQVTGQVFWGQGRFGNHMTSDVLTSLSLRSSILPILRSSVLPV